jgi:hypothetical protein
MPAQAYRRCAAECLELSLAIADQEARELLKQMALSWRDLADQAEKAHQQQKARPRMGLDFDKLTPDQQRRVLDGLEDLTIDHHDDGYNP